MTAQATYDEMLRDGIRPQLKAIGFTGSGSTFKWLSKHAFSQLGFQKSKYSDRDAVKFTINVTVAEKDAWAVLAAIESYVVPELERRSAPR